MEKELEANFYRQATSGLKENEFVSGGGGGGGGSRDGGFGVGGSRAKKTGITFGSRPNIFASEQRGGTEGGGERGGERGPQSLPGKSTTSSSEMEPLYGKYSVNTNEVRIVLTGAYCVSFSSLFLLLLLFIYLFEIMN
jgi:hypothetical protein